MKSWRLESEARLYTSIIYKVEVEENGKYPTCPFQALVWFGKA